MVSGKQLEVAVVVVAYSLLYMFVVDPIVGSVTGLQAAPLVESTRRGADLWRIVSTIRGWFFILSFFPAIGGYLVIRARIAGEPVAAFWNE